MIIFGGYMHQHIEYTLYCKFLFILQSFHPGYIFHISDDVSINELQLTTTAVDFIYLHITFCTKLYFTVVLTHWNLDITVSNF
jgi:hypothetical protein